MPTLYDSHAPPLHPYVRASSAYSAVVQLYARSLQLPTNLSLASRFADRLRLCRFGCPTLEDDHHLFVHCPSFDHLRDEYSHTLVSATQSILKDAALSTPVHSHLDRVASSLFRDDAIWPLASSRFYLGLLPPLLPLSTLHDPLQGESPRVFTRLAHTCHTYSIRLAARIWGLVSRQRSFPTANRFGDRRLSTASLLQSSNLSLPPHLHHLL